MIHGSLVIRINQRRPAVAARRRRRGTSLRGQRWPGADGRPAVTVGIDTGTCHRPPQCQRRVRRRRRCHLSITGRSGPLGSRAAHHRPALGTAPPPPPPPWPERHCWPPPPALVSISPTRAHHTAGPAPEQAPHPARQHSSRADLSAPVLSGAQGRAPSRERRPFLVGRAALGWSPPPPPPPRAVASRRS